MDTSLASVLSVQSLRASLSGASYESGIAPASSTNDSEVMQLSGVRLSARERTIVLLMGHGLSNKRIARQLSIAPETVKSHAKRIFWKLTAQTRAQAVYRASALGLI
jgi:ATP/maltotriose-dependent transcriptional regulator MalT